MENLKETLLTVFWAFLLAFVIRTFLFQPFNIPSGSMQPILVKGDYIITSKLSLGYGKYAAAPIHFPVKTGRLMERAPKRGDVIVFRPTGQDKNFIKRLVGLPGEEIQMRDGRLHINGVAVKTEVLGTEIRKDSSGQDDKISVLSETFDNGHTHKIYNARDDNKLDNTEVFIVPSGHYFFMGDNRDYSADSRVSSAMGGAGFVPAENLMGRAEFVLLSVEDDFSVVRPWTWFKMRGDRFFKGIQ